MIITSENTWSTATATFFSSQRKLSAKAAGLSGTVLPDAEASCRARQMPQVISLTATEVSCGAKQSLA